MSKPIFAPDGVPVLTNWDIRAIRKAVKASNLEVTHHPLARLLAVLRNDAPTVARRIEATLHKREDITVSAFILPGLRYLFPHNDDLGKLTA
jgi:hypothetical protein